MRDFKIKIWDDMGKPLFSIKDADPKKLKKKMDEILKNKLM